MHLLGLLLGSFGLITMNVTNIPLSVSPLFGDHMVLQQQMPVPVWGWAQPSAPVAVTLGETTVRTTADERGAWCVALPARTAGGPLTLQVSDGANTQVFEDVLIGEVWLCSGQSNMEWPLSNARNAEQEIANAAHPRIRHFSVRNQPGVAPARSPVGEWQVCSPDTIGPFSAVGYFFGRDLEKALDVPIGLIDTAWGGTRIEAWISRTMLQRLPAGRRALAQFDEVMQYYQNGRALYDELLQRWERETDKLITRIAPNAADWATCPLDADWQTMELPGMWQQQGLNLNGVVWFRREVTIPAALRGKDLLLHFGPIDDFDTTWLNGTKVGGMGKETAQSYATPRRYDVPAATVQAGANTLTVRVVDNYGNGGFAGLARDMYLTAADDPAGVRVDLSGVWHYKVESVLQTKKPEVPVGPEDPNSPAGLYHGRICPLASYALRGVIWYQGESNAGRAHEYRDLMKALIYDWRAAWRQPQLDFYQVQLANFMERSERPRDSQWAELREAQAAAARETPGCGLAVIIDVGEANDIHPRNKQDVGKRLALQALHTTYNRDIVCAGPTFRTVAFNGNEATIAFDNIGGGLVTRDNEPLVGFAIAGADRKFVWAQARIDGDTVLVWNDAIGTPVAVRYAWGDNPACNLYNREGLPAMPFRTDDWQPGDVKR